MKEAQGVEGQEIHGGESGRGKVGKWQRGGEKEELGDGIVDIWKSRKGDEWKSGEQAG